jgi:hypothetical protein
VHAGCLVSGMHSCQKHKEPSALAGGHAQASSTPPPPQPGQSKRAGSRPHLKAMRWK